VVHISPSLRLPLERLIPSQTIIPLFSPSHFIPTYPVYPPIASWILGDGTFTHYPVIRYTFHGRSGEGGERLELTLQRWLVRV
jgi:hypothetical protein